MRVTLFVGITAFYRMGALLKEELKSKKVVLLVVVYLINAPHLQKKYEVAIKYRIIDISDQT